MNEVAVILLIISLIVITALALSLFCLMKILKITIIKKGELKSHFDESKKKLGIWHPILLLRRTSDDMNASTFFFGVIISSIIIEKLNKYEQFAIIDHELGHIKRWWDWLILFYFLAPFVLISYILLEIFNMEIYFSSIFWKVWPWISTLLFVIFLILRFSKPDLKMKSEFKADRISAELGNAKALISSLKKMEEYDKQPHSGILKHIIKFINIVFLAIYKCPSHPSTEERIKKLDDSCSKLLLNENII